jgi:hypothetical protein
MKRQLSRLLLAVLSGALLVLALLVFISAALEGELAQSVRAMPASPATGDPFPIAAVPGNDENRPVVAHDEGRNWFLVVYENAGGQNAVCMDAQGNTIRTYVVGTGQHPDVVYSGDHDQYLVVYDDGAGDIEGQFVSGTCCAQVGCIGAPFTISTDRPDLEYDPAVAYNRHSDHQDYLVVWADTAGLPSHWAIYARQVLSMTQLPNPSFAITDTASAWNYEPDVAYNLNMNEYLVVYTSDPSKAMDPNARDVYGRRVYNTGGPGLLAEHPIDATWNSQDSPSVAAYRLNYTTPYLVVYEDDWNDPAGDVRGYLLFTDGLPSTLLNIDTTPGVQEGEPDVTSSEPSGGFTIVWSRHDFDWDIYGRRVGGTGDMEPTFRVYVGSDDQMEAAVAGGSPTPLAVWQSSNGSDWDIYGRFLLYCVYLPLVLR